MGETLKTLYAADTELGRWLRTKNIIERVGKIIFVHAGISSEVAAYNLSFDEMNRLGRFRIDSICKTPECSAVTGGSKVGLFWFRGMAQQKLTQQSVDSILDVFRCERVIVGHTIFDSISTFYNNKLIAIDLDHAENINKGFFEALYYKNSKFSVYTILNNKRKIRHLNL